MAFYDREVLGRILDVSMRRTVPLRRELLANAAGRVLEIGFGTGLNVPAYPRAVRELVAVDPSRGLLERARKAQDRFHGALTVLEASAAEALPLDAASFDAVVITFVLCSCTPVTAAVLGEAKRLLRPGAPLLIAEHVLATGRATASVQRAVRPVWSALLGGCNPAFDARRALEDAGFDTQGVRDTALPLPFPVHTGIVGAARPTQPGIC